jgi:HSP20 family protein
MNKQIIIGIAIVFAVILGIQAYMIFQMNERLEGLGELDNRSSDFQFKIQSHAPKISDPKTLKPIPDGEFFKDLPWSAYEEMQHMQNEMEQLFSETYSRFHLNTPAGNFSKVPEVNLQVTPDLYVITMNAPGADVSSVNVKLEDRVLHVSIKTQHEEENKKEEKQGEYRFRERFIGEFHRAISLPGPADATKIETAYFNGILTIKVPKK